jgi:hypothetical protein
MHTVIILIFVDAVFKMCMINPGVTSKAGSTVFVNLEQPSKNLC